MGRVTQVLPDSVVIATEPTSALVPLKPGDGVVFDAADWRSPEEREEGGRVYRVASLHAGLVELGFGRGAIDPARKRAGDLLWRSPLPGQRNSVRPMASTPPR